ncbi:hypothetical protein GGX14DRAFT_555936 [Mycena pura]|uniref:Uncharacterized protein n=1 Tax=Mycena pura TaxID=153505 RepID=A0AAD7E442_9AGAR|nr:hypothetical protein GGX14DRAFT_555936 [Mycena pura]
MTALQTTFYYFRADDDRCPRRRANPFETQILTSLVAQVHTFFQIPRIVRLVAISLQLDPSSEVDVDTTVVSSEEIAAAQTLLAMVPQIDLVEGLVPEGRVIKARDPSNNRPVRIDIRAERILSLCCIAAQLDDQYATNTAYRRAFAWAFCVILHEVMHYVRDAAFVRTWEKKSPPRLRSANYPQTEIWHGPPPTPRSPASSHSLGRGESLAWRRWQHFLVALGDCVRLPCLRLRSVPTTPSGIKPRAKGESGYWLEEELFGGAYLAAKDSDLITPHTLIEVPEGLKLCLISHIQAKVVCEGGYKIWSVDDELDQLIGPFTDGE